MKFITLLVTFFLSANQAFATTLVCGDRNLNAAPYFTFIFNFDGDPFYPTMLSIGVVSSAFHGSEEVVKETPVSGCQGMSLVGTSSGVDFECDADGDAGYGSIDLFTEGTAIVADIIFPEGKNLGRFGVEEDTEFSLICHSH